MWQCVARPGYSACHKHPLSVVLPSVHSYAPAVLPASGFEILDLRPRKRTQDVNKRHGPRFKSSRVISEESRNVFQISAKEGNCGNFSSLVILPLFARVHLRGYHRPRPSRFGRTRRHSPKRDASRANGTCVWLPARIDLLSAWIADSSLMAVSARHRMKGRS